MSRRSKQQTGMTANQILSLGLQMREKQIEFFRTKDQLILAECKRLEQNFDRAARAYLTHGDMFNG